MCHGFNNFTTTRCKLFDNHLNFKCFSVGRFSQKSCFTREAFSKSGNSWGGNLHVQTFSFRVRFIYVCRGLFDTIAMIRFNLNIEEFTPEISQILEQLQAHAGVKIAPRKEQSAWDEALLEGAVDVDVFFDELNSRIDKWSDTRV